MPHTTTRRPPPAKGARPGNLVVTTFMLSIGVMVMVGGVSTMLRSQIDGATKLQKISIAKLQATYLAEMGVNQLMYDANTAPDAANPFGVVAGSGQGKRYDLKAQVAMVREDAAGVAECVIVRQAASGGVERFQVQARLVTQGETFRRVLDFSTRKKPGAGGQWVLASYNLVQ